MIEFQNVLLEICTKSRMYKIIEGCSFLKHVKVNLVFYVLFPLTSQRKFCLFADETQVLQAS